MAGDGAPPSATITSTEDAVQALIEYLVDPVLAMNLSPSDPPDAQQEEAVGKQVDSRSITLVNLLMERLSMHAVVILYNYYHRKQFRQLPFLGFEPFCKVAVNAKGNLGMYMNFLSRCEGVSRIDSQDHEKHLSITEKMVMDACNICTSLDASEDVPDMETWPFSKVAVFLVDSAKEKCLLQFCAVTQGVWSLVEKDIDAPIDNLSEGPNMRTKAKRKRTTIESAEDEFDDVPYQLALSVVKEKTGIDCSNLCLLEHHKAYSISREKATTQLFIMIYTKSANEEFMEVPIKDVLSSLIGPLFGRSGTSEVTEYYHLLPYTGILSDWQSRQSSTREICGNGSLNVVKPQAAKGVESSLEPDRKPTLNDHDTNERFNQNEPSSNTLHHHTGKIENMITYKRSDTSLSDARCGAPLITDNSAMKLEKLPKMGVQAINDKSSCSAETMHILCEKTKTNSTLDNNKGPSRSSVIRSTEDVCNKKVDKSSMTNQYLVSSPVQHVESRKNAISGAHIDKMEVASKQAVEVDSVENLGTARSIHGEYLVGTTTSKSVKEKNTGRAITIHPAQDRTAACDLSHVRKVVSESQDIFRLVSVPKKNDLLETSLRVLHNRRNELCQQQRLLADEVAQREMNIQRILAGGEANLTSNIELVLETLSDICSSQTRSAATVSVERSLSEKMKRRRLSEAILSLQSPCEELDSICCDNNWILPRYCVLPSFADGMFRANIIVEGMDFKFTVSGDLRSSPLEARESASSHMLSKLRNARHSY